MADQVKVSIDTRAGRASLVYGRLFVGGVYDLQVETDGQADTTRLVRIYRFDVARRIKWALAEAKGGGQLFLDSEDFRKAFLTVAPSRALPCEFIVYDDDAIVAQGNVVVEWSPTLTTVDGKPVDVQGPPGEKGDKGEQGPKGDDGKSAYQGAVEQGYQGTEREFYASLCSLNDLVEAAATSARAAAVSAETAAAETLVGAQQLTDTVTARKAAEDAASRAEEAAAGTVSAAEAAKRAEEAAKAAQEAAEKVGDFSGHLEDHDNPHQVTAEQVPCGTTSSAIAVLDGADNWGTVWGFDLDLRSLNPDAWEGRADGTVAQVTTVGLQVSGSAGKNIQAKLELTGTDGAIWTSTDTASWQGSGLAVDYTFDPPARLPDGVLSARFLTEAGAAVAVPMRISKVSASETPAGCDVWTAEGGTSKRTDFAPRVRETQYALPPQSVAEALANIELTPGPQGPKGDKGDKGDPGDDASVAIDTTMPSAPADDHVPSTQLLKEELAKKLSLTGGTLTGTLTVNASVTATSFNIPQGTATHDGGIISIPNGPQMAGAVGLVYKRPQQSNFKPVFLGVSGGDTDSRIQLGDGSTPNAETGLTTVFGLYTPDDRTWARHDLWFTDKLGDEQGPRTWWGLVQDGDELRIVKDKGTPTAYLKLDGGTAGQSVAGPVRLARLYVNEIFSGGAAEFFKVVSSLGFRILNIHQLVAWGGKTFMDNKADGVYLNVKSIQEDGQALVDKYATKTYVDGLVGDINAALAQI